MKWVSMTKQPHTSLGWGGVKRAAIELWSSGNSFPVVINHASPSGSQTDEYGFGRCQENYTSPTV
jgi:hypothetical protein